jgi:hypothetical protein
MDKANSSKSAQGRQCVIATLVGVACCALVIRNVWTIQASFLLDTFDLYSRWVPETFHRNILCYFGFRGKVDANFTWQEVDWGSI